MKDIQSGFIAA